MRSRPPLTQRLCRPAAPVLTTLAALAALALQPARSQEFSRFITCSGTFTAAGQRSETFLDLALRQANFSATIQRSNVLPVGEALEVRESPVLYSMTYVLPRQGTQVLVVPGWFANTVFVHYPDLKRLNQIRLAIDRQTGALTGQVLNEADEVLGRTEMQCRARSAEELRAPKL